MVRYKNSNKKLPKKSNNKKGLAFWVVFVLMCFWTVGSALSIYNFVDKKPKERLVASAETALGASFYSKDFFVPTSRYTRTTGQVENNNHVGNFLKVRFSLNSQGIDSPTFGLGIRAIATVVPNDPTFNGEGYTSNNPPILSIYDGEGYNLSPNNTFYPQFNFNPSTDNGREFFLGYTVGSGNYTNYDSYLGKFSVYADVQFNGIPVKYEISSGYTDRDNGRVCKNTFTYYDVNGFKFSISFLKWINNNLYTNFFTLEYAEYYLEDLPGSGDNSPDYIAGKIVGIQEGLEKGREEGYQNGLREGKIQGESIGYNKGIEAANNYSFLGLFSALVDVPVRTVSSLFDFTVLGFNLKQLVFSLFTLCVIILIIRLIVGGGKNDK